MKCFWLSVTCLLQKPTLTFLGVLVPCIHFTTNSLTHSSFDATLQISDEFTTHFGLFLPANLNQLMYFGLEKKYRKKYLSCNLKKDLIVFDLTAVIILF